MRHQVTFIFQKFYLLRNIIVNPELSHGLEQVSRPVPFIPRDGIGIGTGFSKWDGIVPTLRAAQTGNQHNSEIVLCPTQRLGHGHGKRDQQKQEATHNLNLREALEIRRHNSGPGHGLNKDQGAYGTPYSTKWAKAEGRRGANPVWVCLFWSSLQLYM